MEQSLLRYKDRVETKRIILHDSHTVPEVLTIEDVPRWSQLAQDGALEMGLLSIGYHFIIERDGSLVECRPLQCIGSHTPGHNMDSIGVCLVGGREQEVNIGVDNFTKEQRRMLCSLVLALEKTYPGIELKGHTEVQRYRDREKPNCPPIDMDILREDIRLFAMGIEL